MLPTLPALADSTSDPAGPLGPLRRRSFLKYAGAAAGVTALGLAGCKKDSASPGIDLGTGDVGVLNYAYALEQVESIFYGKVLAGAYFNSLSKTSAEYQLFTDLALHEQVHVDLLRTALKNLGGPAVKTLVTVLDDLVNFGDRTTVAGAGKLGVLNAAQQLEDLGVAAYNGAARYLVTADYLTLAGKIVSVEARHAALIRDLLQAGGASGLGLGFIGPDVVDATSHLELSLAPAAVLPRLNAFLAADSQLTAAGLA